MIKKLMIIVILFTICGFAFSASPQGKVDTLESGNISFIWDKNIEPDLKGYRFTYGKNNFGNSVLLAPDDTTLNLSIKDGDWQFRLAAFDSTDNFSPFSDTLFVIVLTDTLPSKPRNFRIIGSFDILVEF